MFLLPYSSGTTGVAKGVELTHGNLTAQMAQYLHPRFRVFQEVNPEYSTEQYSTYSAHYLLTVPCCRRR